MGAASGATAIRQGIAPGGAAGEDVEHGVDRRSGGDLVGDVTGPAAVRGVVSTVRSRRGHETTSCRAITAGPPARGIPSTKSPAPVRAMRSPLTNWSANTGTTTTGRPAATAPKAVPDPPWHTTRSARGKTSA